MGQYTDVILCYSSLEAGDSRGAIESEIDAALTAEGFDPGRLRRTQEELSRSVVRTGFYKNLDEDALIQALEMVWWAYPQEVKIFLSREEEDGFEQRADLRRLTPRELKEIASKGFDLEGPPAQTAFFERWRVLREQRRSERDAVERNPLRTFNAPWMLAETQTVSPWLFEIAHIGRELHGSSGRPAPDPGGDPAKSKWTQFPWQAFGVHVIYHGQPAFIDVTSEDVGGERYQSFKQVVATANVGDRLVVSGHVAAHEGTSCHIDHVELVEVRHRGPGQEL